MTVALPPGWTVTPTLETVPDPNFPGITAGPGFTRWTYIATDAQGGYLCSSGSLEDCENQALSLAQARTQQQPYDEAI